MKSQSVRSQRKFEESMATWLQNIDNNVYAAENLCPYSEQQFTSHTLGVKTFRTPDGCNGCVFCGKFNFCKLMSLRNIIGDHTPQHDIEGVEMGK